MSDDPLEESFLDRVLHHERRHRRNVIDPEIRHHFVDAREEGPDRVHEDERNEEVDP